MKKVYLTLLAIMAFAGINAASFTVSIVGNSYSPATLNVNVGDVITIQANGNHPLVEVDQTTWAASGTSSLSSGWGVKTSDYTFTVSTVGTIYYVCQIHGPMGMKGQIAVSAATGVEQNSVILNNVNVFPNPAKEKLYVSLSSAAALTVTIKLFSVNGQEVAVLSNRMNLAAGNNTVDLMIPAGLSAGNYLLQIASDSKQITKQILIVN